MQCREVEVGQRVLEFGQGVDVQQTGFPQAWDFGKQCVEDGDITFVWQFMSSVKFQFQGFHHCLIKSVDLRHAFQSWPVYQCKQNISRMCHYTGPDTDIYLGRGITPASKVCRHGH